MIYVNRFDKNDVLIKNGDIIDIHQTVNGCNLFIILSVNPLDIRYSFDISYRYQYDQEELLKRCQYSGDVEFEIIGNVNDMVKNLIDMKYA